jgi:hypothetical protein
MPRPRKGPRLYLDAKHGYVIRDGGVFIRTGCAQHQLAVAEKQLAEYIGKKHQPQASPAPLIADVLLVYLNEHLAHSRSRSKATPVTNLAAWWGDKRVSDITSASCRAYIAHKGERTVAARRDLQTLKAAVNYWHKSEYGPLDRVPAVVMPPAPESRERWLTRSELARLLWAARRTPHLRRFILIGYYTGSRSGVVRELQWSWIDWNGGTMRRRAIGEAEQSNKRRPREGSGNVSWRTCDAGTGSTGHTLTMWSTTTASLSDENCTALTVLWPGPDLATTWSCTR